MILPSESFRCLFLIFEETLRDVENIFLKTSLASPLLTYQRPRLYFQTNPGIGWGAGAGAGAGTHLEFNSDLSV